MHFLSKFSSRFKIGVRIAAGFAVVLLLLAAVAAKNYFALDEVRGVFASYSRTSGNAMRLAEIDTNFGSLRRSVLLYSQSGSQQAQDAVKAQSAALSTSIDEAMAGFTSPERRAMLDKLKGEVAGFMKNFDLIVQARIDRDHAVNDEMNPRGAKLSALADGVTDSAIKAGDMTVAAHAGQMSSRLMQMRLAANRFLLAHEPKLKVEVETHLKEVAETATSLAGSVTNPEWLGKIRQLAAEAPGYKAAFDNATAKSAERERLMSTVAAKIAEEVAATVVTLRQSQMKSLETNRAGAEQTISSGILVALIVTGSAMVLGILAAWLIGSGITTPLRAIASVLDQLAHGNKAVDIPYTENRDEVGDNARAAQIFKENLLRIEKMEAEQKEAEARAAADREAAAQQMADEFQAAVGGIVQAAVAGDFSQRVDLAGKSGLVLNVGTSLNTLCTNVARALGDFERVLGSLAEGDLTKRIDAEYQGMFGRLKADANRMAEQLTSIVSRIKSGAGEVAGASSEISQGTTDLSQRTEEQAASLEQTSASMEEISATVKKNAENAQTANQSAAQTREMASRGGEVVGQAVAAMARIEESSRKISDIISVIDEIARQTNLLALNAAVEAARAGDAGRGFAVVASEVRSLAQRSSQAAKDITDLIQNSTSQVQDGVKLVNDAGEQLKGIVESINGVAQIVAEIAGASAEQAGGIDQVNKALSQMDEVTQQNSALVEENAAAAKTLEQQAATMNEQVGFFRLTTDGEERRAATAVAA